MQTKKNNQQHISIRARCTGQFVVYLATGTFQSIQNYLYKLSGKRLSGKRLVRETSVRESDCPGNVCKAPGTISVKFSVDVNGWPRYLMP